MTVKQHHAAETVVVHELKGNAATLGGRLQMVGGAKASSDVAALEAGLRDNSHRVAGQGSHQVKDATDYPWSFDETISIAPSLQAATKAGKTP